MTAASITTLIANFIAAAVATCSVLLIRSWKSAQETEFGKAMGREEFSDCSKLLSSQIRALESRLEGLEHEKENHAAWISQAENVQLNRRGQVIRLHRRGESVPEISAALRVGQGEVKLMLKVYELCREVPTHDQDIVPAAGKRALTEFKKREQCESTIRI